MDAPGSAVVREPHRRSGVLLWSLLVPLVMTAVGEVGMGAWAGGWFDDGSHSASDVVGEAAFTAWELAPFAAMVFALVVAVRRRHSGWPAYAVGVLALVVLTATSMWGFVESDSSTSALVFLFLPVVQWMVVLASAALAAAFGWALSRRRQRLSTTA